MLNRSYSDYIIYLFFLVFVYLITKTILQDYNFVSFNTFLLSFPVIFACSIATYFLIKRSGVPAALYGMNLKKWKKDLLESIYWTIPLLGLYTLLKWLLIRGDPERSVFEPTLNPGNTVGQTSALLIFIVNFFSIVLWEYVFRGGVQSSLYRFLEGKGKNLFAIVLPSSLFALFHLHFPAIFVGNAFFLGVVFSALYARQKSLVGVIFIHMAIAYYCYYILTQVIYK